MRLLLMVACASVLWGCQLPAEPKQQHSGGVEVLSAKVDAARFLSPSAAAAAAAGAGELSPVGAAAVSEGDQLGSFVQVPESACLLALARSGGSVRDVDLFVYSDGGDRIASDESPDAHAAVLICPPHPRRIYVAARVIAGGGMLALGVVSVPAQHAEAVARAVHARFAGQDTGKLQAWPGLERKIRERRAALGSRWDDVRRVAIQLDQRAYAAVSMNLEAGRCLDVLVAPSNEVHGIDAYVVDGTDRVVARGRPPGRDRGIVICGAHDAALTLMVRPRIASGVAAIVIGRSPKGAAAELADNNWVDSASPIVDLKRALARHAARTDKLRMGAAQELAATKLTVGSTKTLPITLSPGCARIDIVGAKPLGSFGAELWADSGMQISKARGGEVATMFRCGGNAKARVELSAEARAGEVQIRARYDDKPPKLLLAHPVAAGRLLGRLEAAAGPIDPRHAERVTAVKLAAAGRHVLTVTAPVGACVELVAAVAGDASGVELRMSDGVTERVARGMHVASQQLCGDTAPKRAEVSLRVGSGAATVLLLERPLP